MNIPIIIAAFGTTSRARETYTRVDDILKDRFKGHQIHWAFSSRIVRNKLKQRSVVLPSPSDVVSSLAKQGHTWAVVQSFNMICGHEFHRLKEDVMEGPLRISLGHSLLCNPDDYMAVAHNLSRHFEENQDEAVVLVGHGTDHCAWAVYPAFERFLKRRYGHRAFVGVIEGEFMEKDEVSEQVAVSGFRKVRLVPLMLVAGVHMEEDLKGPEDSWTSAFQKRGIDVSLVTGGLGTDPGIIRIFGEHIENALAVIPGI